MYKYKYINKNISVNSINKFDLSGLQSLVITLANIFSATVLG